MGLLALQPLLVEGVGVEGICCSSLFGVFVDDVGVGSAEVKEHAAAADAAVVFTLPIIGEQESTKGESSLGVFSLFSMVLAEKPELLESPFKEPALPTAVNNKS